MPLSSTSPAFSDCSALSSAELAASSNAPHEPRLPGARRPASIPQWRRSLILATWEISSANEASPQVFSTNIWGKSCCPQSRPQKAFDSPKVPGLPQPRPPHRPHRCGVGPPSGWHPEADPRVVLVDAIAAPSPRTGAAASAVGGGDAPSGRRTALTWRLAYPAEAHCHTQPYSLRRSRSLH